MQKRRRPTLQKNSRKGGSLKSYKLNMVHFFCVLVFVTGACVLKNVHAQDQGVDADDGNITSPSRGETREVLNAGSTISGSTNVQEKKADVLERIELEPKKLDVILGIDSIEKLDFAASPQIQIGNTSVVDYVFIPQKREITFKGLRPGTSSVTIRDMVGDIKIVYQINVIANDNSEIVQQLNAFLGDIEGLEIGLKGDRVYVGGNIVVPNDIGRVAAVLKDQKYDKVLRLVELSPHTQQSIAERMQKEIQNAQMPNVTVRVVNGLYWLEGVVESDGQRGFAEKIAAAYLPDNILSLARQYDSVQTATKSVLQNFISVNAKPQPPQIPKLIKISAQFVELSKSYGRYFGFSWKPLMNEDQSSITFGKAGDGGLTTTSENTLTGTISNLFPKLASAKSAGHARIIQSGSTVVEEKKQASISKTKSTPFTMGDKEYQRSETATAGFDLNVTPTILQEEDISIDIGLSVSSTTPATPPITTSNRIKTILMVKSRDSAVVGGISMNESATAYDKNTPGGETKTDDNISPLFNFLKSKDFINAKSQFVVFVTPEIVKTATEETDRVIRKFRRARE